MTRKSELTIAVQARRIDRLEKTLLLLMARPADYDWQNHCEALALEMHNERAALGLVPPQLEIRIAIANENDPG